MRWARVSAPAWPPRIGEELTVTQQYGGCCGWIPRGLQQPEFGLQLTGVPARFGYLRTLRQVGADTRALILAAAARTRHQQRGSALTTATSSPATKATSMAILLPSRPPLVPTETPVKDASAFKYIGTHFARIDAEAKATGTASFGIDIDLPDMVRGPVLIGGGRESVRFDDEAARRQPGVQRHPHIQTVVVADSYWQANQAAKKLTVEWEDVALTAVDSTG